MIYIDSETKKLEKIIVHEPGEELINLTPGLMAEFLFDDIPFLDEAIKEHRFFVECLKKEGVEVYYLKDLLISIFESEVVRGEFIEEFLNETNIFNTVVNAHLSDYLYSLDKKNLVNVVISGLKKVDFNRFEKKSLEDHLDVHPFLLLPMTNLYFMRDPGIVVKDLLINSTMSNNVRQRETILLEYIYKYHPLFKDNEVISTRYEVSPLEGGDLLVINSELVLIGISERTKPHSIDVLSDKLLKDANFKYVLAVDIPKKRAFMHLDTLMTQVNHHTFLVHPLIKDVTTYLIKKEQDEIVIIKNSEKIIDCLSALMNKEVHFIKCGGDDLFASYREQWNDGANVMCIDENVIISYARNTVTNKVLKEKGIRVIEIPSSELSRGRGGPRCMSMPIKRK